MNTLCKVAVVKTIRSGIRIISARFADRRFHGMSLDRDSIDRIEKIIKSSSSMAIRRGIFILSFNVRKVSKENCALRGKILSARRAGYYDLASQGLLGEDFFLAPPGLSLREVENRYIAYTMSRNAGRAERERTAKSLQITTRTLYNRLQDSTNV